MHEPFQPRPDAGKSQWGLRCHFQNLRSRMMRAGLKGTSRGLPPLVCLTLRMLRRLSMSLGRMWMGLAHPQAAVVDEGEVGLVAVVPKGGQESGDFLAGEDVGQRFLAPDPDLAPDLPGFSEVVAVEGAQGADGLVEGGTGELAPGLEVEEEIENLARC